MNGITPCREAHALTKDGQYAELPKHWTASNGHSTGNGCSRIIG